MPERLEAVIFDLDGTVADSLPVCYAAFRAALLAPAGRTYTDNEINGLFGPDELGGLRRVLPEPEAQDAFRNLLAAYQDALERLRTTAFPGMVELLAELRDRGVCIGLVTGKGAETTELTLAHLNLAGCFDAIASGSPEGGVKPRRICDLLDLWSVAPECAAYAGDVPGDMRAAKQAGVVAIAAAWAPTASAELLAAEQPAVLFTTVAELRAWLAEITCG